MDDATLVLCNGLGIIPGPQESEEGFAQRAQEILKMSGESIEKRCHLPFARELKDYPQALKKALSLYDISPLWVPLVFSNQQLAPWQGACSWIFTAEERAAPLAFIQLRARFKDHENYLFLYDREELIAHEIAHIGRIAFEEPKFEEIIAYQSSSSAYQRLLGPLIETPSEAMLLVLFLIISFLTSLAQFWVEIPLYPALFLWGAPLMLSSAAALRLSFRLWQWRCCQKHLMALLKDAKRASALIYRLTDAEIIAFGRMDPSAIAEYALSRVKENLRWRMLTLCYHLG